MVAAYVSLLLRRDLPLLRKNKLHLQDFPLPASSLLLPVLNTISEHVSHRCSFSPHFIHDTYAQLFNFLVPKSTAKLSDKLQLCHENQ